VERYTLYDMRRPYVVQVRLTRNEMKWVDQMARVRRVTIEELIREQLRLTLLDAEALPPPERHLHVIQPGPVV